MSEGSPLWRDERVIAWVAKRMQAQSTRDELVDESRTGAHGWPLPGTYLTRVQVSQIQAILADREVTGRQPQRKRRRGNWNGVSNSARAGELKERKKAGGNDYLDTLKWQDVIVQLCAALEAFDVAGYEFGGETGVWYASDLLDDLISLDIWLNRAIPTVQRWLQEEKIRGIIETLRNPEGRTPEEIRMFRRRAAKLERQLGLVLTAG